MADNERDVGITPTDAAQELWQRETHALAVQMFRARTLVVPMLLLVGVLFLLFDPDRWKAAFIALGAVFVMVLFVLESMRLRRRQATEHIIHVNMLYGIVIQSCLIYVTGGIASPLLAAYLPIAILAGLSMHSRWRVYSVVAVPAAFLIMLAIGAGTGVFPPMVPAFFGSEGPLLHDSVWLFTRVGVVLMVLNVGAVTGMRVRAAFDRVVRGAVQVRQGALDTLESRNRENLSTAVTIAHELKNPLSSIQGLTQLLARNAEVGTKDRERIDVILREIQRMTTVLDEFRSFSRPMSGLTRSPVSMTDIAANVVSLHEGNAASRGVRLTLVPAENAVADCDAQKVKQALVNLVQNALEASPRCAEVTVRVLADSHETVALKVADQGAGIDDTLRDKLFTPGFTTKERGTGIGLVVARSVVEQHGGKLNIASRSASGKVISGTEATIILPRRATDTEVLP